MGTIQETYIGRKERALFEFCIFILHLSLKEREQASKPALSWLWKRHLIGMMEWPVTSEEVNGVSEHADLQTSSRCQQNRDLWTAGEGWWSDINRITPDPMQGANCISLLELVLSTALPLILNLAKSPRADFPPPLSSTH